ncbi:hypothetical protein BKA56DRAFT_649716 [Ilyonectria sp. MPI-CAGE-AT-0026]|nr:hypothetical protein BKA56DRAFT_649716 [Ilyonectria sp. MPI-CAGE-AT-0026]
MAPGRCPSDLITRSELQLPTQWTYSCQPRCRGPITPGKLSLDHGTKPLGPGQLQDSHGVQSKGSRGEVPQTACNFIRIPELSSRHPCGEFEPYLPTQVSAAVELDRQVTRAVETVQTHAIESRE